MELPPRFSPDNSPEARAQRVAATSDFSYEHALAWIRSGLGLPQIVKEIVELEYIPEETSL